LIRAGTRLGNYQVLAPLGAGGMGEVYRARDARLGREVAVKVLPGEMANDRNALDRFEREARAVAALSHPNILAIFDFGREGSVSFAVTELLEGDTLRSHLAAGPLPARKTADYALQIVSGLAAAHAKGIVHRDLKPENLFVTKDGFVKILDFGLARASPPPGTGATQAPTAPELTEPGTVMGTVGYMSPEQARGRPADARSDLFSFGAILYEMLSGERPFQRDTAPETLTAILRDDPPELPEKTRNTLPVLERIARRCLEKDPEARFQVARDLAFALEAVAGSPARRPASPGGAEKEPPSKRSVAVLFFKDLARDPQNAHLGLGLADATITELSLVKSLLVRPTAAILRYQDRSVEPVVAGRELGVHAVVDGSFQRSGSRLRVTVQLVATSDGRSLWGSKIDTTVDDIFRMQDEVSRRIAEALEVELSPADEKRLAAAARPAGKANELYLKGRAHIFFESIDDVNAAIEDFEEALREDPRSVYALVGLATAYARMGFTFDPEGNWLERAEAMSGKALTIEPGLPEGRCLQGILAWTPRRGFDHAGAIREFLAAIAGSPNLTEAHERLGVVLFHVAMLEESATHARQALATNPDDALAKIHLGFCCYLEGRHEEALELSLAAERGNPSAWGDYQIALCHLKLGDLEAAERRAESGSRRFPGDPLSSSVRGLIAASRGDAAGAREQIALTLRNRKSFGHYHHAQYDMACIHALLGEKAAALDLLTEAAHNGFPCITFFERDPSLASLREEEGFTALMRDLAAECDGYRRLYRDLQSSSGHGSDPGRSSTDPG